MNLDGKRWLILFAGILANLCQGMAYASSVFAVPVMQKFGFMIIGPEGKPVPDMSKWAIAFSMTVAFLWLGMLFAGRIADKKNPRTAIAIGGILFAGGVFLAGFSKSYVMFCISFGIMTSIGSGMAYGSIVSTSVRWFPEKRGMASGLVVGALGFGPVVLAPIGDILVKNMGVMDAFKVLGIAIALIIVLASIIITNPPENYTPAGFTPKTPSQAAAIGKDVDWKKMLNMPRFWALYIMYIFGAFSGLMVISQAKPMAMTLTKLTPNEAITVVMVLAIANAAGRIFWGFVSDRIGRIKSLALMFFVNAIMMLLLPKFAGDKATMMIDLICVGACFGGYLGTFPSLCADSFGAKNMTVNYALLFTGFSIAGVLGPVVGGILGKSHIGYMNAFVYAGILSIIGFAIALVMSRTKKKSIIAES